MHTSMPPCARPLVRYVAFHVGDDTPLGIVVTIGSDRSTATLLASKRWKFSQRQLRVQPWDACQVGEKLLAANAEQAAADELVREALR